ncbi:MAG TPA: hypothetical protein VK610_00130 [Rhodothermales bacterium]|nr:hypothetical protein [Rhodothermales bacterium]
MPEIRIIHALDFLETTVEGTLDLEQSRAVLFKVASANAVDKLDLLLDLRLADGRPLSYTDMYRLLSVLEEQPESFGGKVALLDDYDNDEFAKMQFFEASATLRGFDVRTFSEYEPAMRWLQSGHTPLQPEAP